MGEGGNDEVYDPEALMGLGKYEGDPDKIEDKEKCILFFIIHIIAGLVLDASVYMMMQYLLLILKFIFSWNAE